MHCYDVDLLSLELNFNKICFMWRRCEMRPETQVYRHWCFFCFSIMIHDDLHSTAELNGIYYDFTWETPTTWAYNIRLGNTYFSSIEMSQVKSQWNPNDNFPFEMTYINTDLSCGLGYTFSPRDETKQQQQQLKRSMWIYILSPVFDNVTNIWLNAICFQYINATR